jgi:hypothetical protein
LRSLPAEPNILLRVSAVLDAYIIEEIKKREEQKRRDDEARRPRLQIEIDPRRREQDHVPEERDKERDPHDEDRPEEEEDDPAVSIRML